jgi:hypothetical protein
MAGHRLAEATPSFGRLGPAMTKYESFQGLVTADKAIPRMLARRENTDC